MLTFFVWSFSPKLISFFFGAWSLKSKTFLFGTSSPKLKSSLFGACSPKLKLSFTSKATYYLSTRIDHALLAHFKATFLPKIETRDYNEVHHSYDPFDKIINEIVIGEALEKLNEKQKEAITFYFFEELTQEEAALKSGITQASFSKRLDRALKTLKGIIEDPL